MKITPALLGVIAGSRRSGGGGPISFVAGADSVNGSISVILPIPAHAANDLIIAHAHGASASTPVLPSGWTNILYRAYDGVSNPTRLYCIRDSGNTVNTLTLPDGTNNIAFLIYRNASGAGVASIGDPSALGPTSGSTPSLGALTAGSWVVAGIDINQGAELITDPAGLTSRVKRPLAMGGGTGSVADTNGIVTSYAGGDVFTWVTAGYMSTFAFEILNG